MDCFGALRLPAPSGLPKKMAIRLAAHDDGVSVLSDAAGELDAMLAELADSAAGAMSGADVAKLARAVRQRRYNVARARVSLLVATAALAGELGAVVGARAEKARAAADDALAVELKRLAEASAGGPTMAPLAKLRAKAARVPAIAAKRAKARALTGQEGDLHTRQSQAAGAELSAAREELRACWAVLVRPCDLDLNELGKGRG